MVLDDRCGEYSLGKACPGLYSLISFREAWVAQLWEWTEEVGHGTLTRHNNDWDITLENLFKILHGLTLEG